MTHTFIVTGNAGPGIVSAAAAMALHAAEQGRRTLLYSLATSPAALSALLGATLGNAAPTGVAPNLDVLALEPLEELRTTWELSRSQLAAQSSALTADELPMMPGIDTFLGLRRLRELAPNYELVVLDAGPHDGLLRVLAAPDSLRWLTRLLLGLERDPGRSSASVARALLPTAFIPLDVRERAQTIRVEAEQVRDELLDPTRSSAYYVLRPDMPALEEARLALPALHLHGLAVSTLLVGPLLPELLADTSLAPILNEAMTVIEAARTTWPGLDLHTFDVQPFSGGFAALRATGAAMEPALNQSPAPIRYEYEGQPAVVVVLPGLAKGALQLTVSGDELIVRIGSYRRHILLPEAMRGGNVRASRDGELLIVRLR